MTADFCMLWKRARAGVPSRNAESVRPLVEILSSTGGLEFVLKLEEKDAQLCMEFLNYSLTHWKLHAQEKEAFLDAFSGLVVNRAWVPDVMAIKDEIDLSSPSPPRKSGGSGDIKLGRHKGHAVVVKTLRGSNAELKKQLCEAIILNSISHPNIQKFVGVLVSSDHQLTTVLEWTERGNIMEYISKHPASELDKLRLLHSAAQGLKYLHDANLAHGDLKVTDIIVTNDRPLKACLTNFGFMIRLIDLWDATQACLTLVEDTAASRKPLALPDFGLRNIAPVQLKDLHAFGLVVFQVLTGKQVSHSLGRKVVAPYIQLCADDAKNIGISNSLWGVAQKYWNPELTQNWIEEVAQECDESAVNNIPQSCTKRQGGSAAREDSGDAGAVGAVQPSVTEVMRSPGKNSEPVLKNSNKEKTPHPAAPPRRGRKGLKYFLNKFLAVFGHGLTF